MADHVAVVTQVGHDTGVVIARRLAAQRLARQLVNPLLPAPPPPHQRNVTARAPWSRHLADSRDRVGRAAALGPEGGRLAPLPARPGTPAVGVWSGRTQ
jgi:hypothetical protein